MIFVTGDTHAQFDRRFKAKSFPEQKEMTKDDYLIICGDFGGIWDRSGESNSEKHWLDWFNDRSYTLLFIDGNHENFDRLEEYPQKEWKGGKIHVIRPSIYHLMRGQVYEIDGKKIFTFGGASSHDMSGGLLDPEDPDYLRKKWELEREYEPYRIKHISWWEQELPSEEEMQEGLNNLQKHDNTVDFIITHCCSTSTQQKLGVSPAYASDILTDYFDRIKKMVKYRKWIFGHYHDNTNVNGKEILIYEQIIRIS